MTVGAGGEGFVLLEHGSINLRQNKCVPLYSLLPAFQAGLSHFDAAVAQCFEVPGLPRSEHSTYWSETYYLDALRHLLSVSRAQGHGACFLIASPRQAADAIEQGRVVIKYRTAGLSMEDLIVFGVTHQLATSARDRHGELTSLRERQPNFASCIKSSLALNAALARYGREWTFTTFETDIRESVFDAIRDCSNSIARFSQVDGAVILTDRLELLGFGCEIRADTNEVLELRRGSDWSARGATPVSADSFGMRHRSAFRFCSSFPGAVALVVSQDGDMKLVTDRRPGLIYWDITPPGVFFK
jgi:hypothetical protein